jgi:hypothetical protein
MSTRYVGTCPVCEARYKVRSGLLVHHGYLRPGNGYIVGDCFAVGRTPHEVSPATAEAYRAATIHHIEVLETSKASVEQALELMYEYRVYKEEIRTFDTERLQVRKGDAARSEGRYWIPSFDEVQKSVLSELAHRLRSAHSTVERMTGLIETWVKQPLTTVEEETVRITAEKKAQRDALKAERDAKKAVQSARRAERDAKLQAKIEVFQTQAWAILDAVNPTDAQGVRNAYLKVLAIKLPSAVQYTFYDEHLNRTELLRSAGLVREHNGGLMTSEYEV